RTVRRVIDVAFVLLPQAVAAQDRLAEAIDPLADLRRAGLPAVKTEEEARSGGRRPGAIIDAVGPAQARQRPRYLRREPVGGEEIHHPFELADLVITQRQAPADGGGG